jgi:hypothetical protein
MQRWEAAVSDIEAREEIEAEWVGLALGKSVITREEFESWWNGRKGCNRFERRVAQRFRQFWPRPSAPKVELDAAINLASPQQLSAALADLFREHGLAVPQDTRSNTLRALMGQHEETDRIIKMLLSWMGASIRIGSRSARPLGEPPAAIRTSWRNPRGPASAGSSSPSAITCS